MFCDCCKCRRGRRTARDYPQCLKLEVEDASLVQSSTATITVAETNLSNKCVYELCYNVCFADSTGAEVLQITSGGTTYPVWDRNGKPLKIGRLCHHRPLYLRFISGGTVHFTLDSCCLPTIHLKTPEVSAV